MRINRVRLVDMVPDIMAALMLRAQVFALPPRAVGEGVARAEDRLADHRAQWAPQPVPPFDRAARRRVARAHAWAEAHEAREKCLRRKRK